MMHGHKEMVVTVKTQKIKEILISNRQKHLEHYQKAKEGYRKLAMEKLQINLAKIERFDPKDKHVPSLDFSNCPKPVCFANRYDEAIGMLELHSGETIVLDLSAYKQFVEDKWDWNNQFLASNSSYLGDEINQSPY